MLTADTATADPEIEKAHALIGGFIVRCSALEFRASQLIARWFCADTKGKYLSYVLHGMSFTQMQQIIEERLSAYHPEPLATRSRRSMIGRISAMMSRSVCGSGW